MSMYSKQFEFLNPVLTVADLELPPLEKGEKAEGQLFELEAGACLNLFTASKRSYSVIRFKEWMEFPGIAVKCAVFTRLETSEQVMLSNGQMASLESDKRIVPVSGNHDFARLLPGAAMLLTEDEIGIAERAIDYVDAVYEEWEVRGTSTIPKAVTMRVLQEVADRREEPRPGYTWIRDQINSDAFGSTLDRRMNFVYEHRKGNQSLRMPELVYEAMQEAVHVAWSAPKGNYKTVGHELKRLVKEDERFHSVRDFVLEDNGRLAIGRTTIQTHFAALDLYTRDLLRYGPEMARRRNRMYLRRNLPLAPLDIVDVDYTVVDVVVYDERFPAAFGRPNLIVFRDRATGIVIGRSLSFSNPSFATFLEGFEHAMFEKDPNLLPPGCRYPWWGKMRRLGVDNAMEFIGRAIEAASKALGFAIVEYRPGEPWLKGALEHMFSTFNEDIFHGVPGTTMNSPEIRKLFDADQPVAIPVISLAELRGMLDYYLARHYHYTPRQGLNGDLTTWSGVPAELWAKKMKDAPRRPLIDRTLFAQLGGQTEQVSVQSDGVRWDSILYFAPELLSIYTHSQNRRARSGLPSTKYKATRDPNNLGRIWVEDPYRRCIIECPAIDRDAEYAMGVTAFQHDQIKKVQLRLQRDAENTVDLLEAKETLHAVMMDLIDKGRKKHAPATTLARFYNENESLHRRGRVLQMARLSSDGRIDIANPESEMPPSPVNSSAIAKVYGSMVIDHDDETLTGEHEDADTAPEPAATAQKAPKTGRKPRRSAARKTTPPEAEGHRDISDIAANFPEWED